MLIVTKSKPFVITSIISIDPFSNFSINVWRDTKKDINDIENKINKNLAESD